MILSSLGRCALGEVDRNTRESERLDFLSVLYVRSYMQSSRPWRLMENVKKSADVSRVTALRILLLCCYPLESDQPPALCIAGSEDQQFQSLPR